MNAGAPDLISKGQEVVVKQQAVHGNRKKLHEIIRVNLRFVPHRSEIREITLFNNLEKSMKPKPLQCKKEDAQSLTDPGDLGQTRSIHPSRKYFLQVPQRMRKFGPTTVSASQEKGGRKCAPSGGPCVQLVVPGGAKWTERKSGRGGGCIYVLREEGASRDGWDQSGKDGQQATDGRRGFHIRSAPKP